MDQIVMNENHQNSPGMPIENIADALLKGSRNIDRMRKDISDLISMLRGLLKFVISGPSRQLQIKIDIPECGLGAKWEISGNFIPMKPGWENQITFDFWTSYSLQWSSMNSHLLAKQIVLVYRSLPALVDGLSREFPDLLSEFAPFVAAARIQFPD